MPLPRRDFLKASLAATAAAALGPRLLAENEAPGREFYELRCYRMKAETRLKTDAPAALLDTYLANAVLPALTAMGLDRIGVFTELDVNKEAVTATPRPASPVWMLIPHASLVTYLKTTATLNTEPAVQQAGAAYLGTPKASPAYERIDSWLLLAFAGMPRLEVPAFSRDRAPGRVFELRDYESHGEKAALSKMAMFDDGEIAVMKDLGLNPVFYGQALAGPDLPHLRYMTGGPDLATHLAHWKKFGPDPRWVRMKADPRYADNTSRNTARFLTPKPYSQL